MAEIPANDFLIGARVKPALSRDDIVMRAGIVLFIGFLAVAVALPLWALYEVGIIFASMMSKPDKNDAEAGEVSTGGPGQD